MLYTEMTDKDIEWIKSWRESTGAGLYEAKRSWLKTKIDKMLEETKCDTNTRLVLEAILDLIEMR